MAVGIGPGCEADGWLSRQLAARPLATNCAASGLLSVVAEVLRHLVFAGPGVRVDLASAARQLALGAGVLAPLATAYFDIVVERLFRGWRPGSVSTVLAQTAAEQACFAPVINAAYIVSNGLLEGRTLAEVRQELSEKFATVMRGNVAFWAPVNLVGYKFVAPRFRQLFGKLVSIAWMMILIQKTRSIEATAKRDAKGSD